MERPPGLFDLDERCAALSAAGDPLKRLAAAVDFRGVPVRARAIAAVTFTVTDTARHDGGPLDLENTARGVWADTAYRSSPNLTLLARQGLTPQFQRAKPRGLPMPPNIVRGIAARVWVAIEHVFATQKCRLGLVIRSIGLGRATAKLRLARRALSGRLNKSDPADAEGLTQLARTGWFREVYVKSLSSDRLRALLAARDRLIRIRKDLEGQIRGILKTFGVKLGPIKPGRERTGFRHQVRLAAPDEPALKVALEALLAAHEAVCREYEQLDGALRRWARDHDLIAAPVEAVHDLTVDLGDILPPTPS